jgi:hypothetical protein
LLYEDFNLRIIADGQGYKVHATFRESRETEELVLPRELIQSLGSFGVCSTASPERPRNFNDDEVGETWAAEVGERLFQALFPRNILRLFDSSLGELKAQPSHGLRVRIHFNPREQRLLPLLSLPWELLRPSQDLCLLGLSRSTPIVRSLDTNAVLRTLPTQHPLRVLIAMAAPRQTARLDLSGERKRIEQAFSGYAEIEVEVIEHTTKKELRRRIREEKFHIIHYMGHGEHDEVARTGALILEAPEGTASPLPAAIFASFFNDMAQPALVFLNACQTASAPPGLGPLAGVAAALVAEGLPAVLAMRTDIEDRTALELSEELYRRLAAGDPVEAALTEARLALHAERPGILDWSIPALFVRGEAATPLPAAEAPPAERPQGPAKRRPEVSQIFKIGSVRHFENVVGDFTKNNGRGGGKAKKVDRNRA